MYTAQLGLDSPIAIRYPRGRGSIIKWKEPFSTIEIGKGELLKEGSSIAVLTIGTMATNAIEAINNLSSSNKVSCYDMRFIKPLDEKLLHSIFKKHTIIITVEDGVVTGGFGSAVAEFSVKHHYKNNLEMLGVSDAFPTQGSIKELQNIAGISSEKITQVLEKYL